MGHEINQVLLLTASNKEAFQPPGFCLSHLHSDCWDKALYHRLDPHSFQALVCGYVVSLNGSFEKTAQKMQINIFLFQEKQCWQNCSHLENHFIMGLRNAVHTSRRFWKGGLGSRYIRVTYIILFLPSFSWKFKPG